jgi:hypothetical protein
LATASNRASADLLEPARVLAELRLAVERVELRLAALGPLRVVRVLDLGRDLPEPPEPPLRAWGMSSSLFRKP